MGLGVKFFEKMAIFDFCSSFFQHLTDPNSHQGQLYLGHSFYYQDHNFIFDLRYEEEKLAIFSKNLTPSGM